MALVFPEAMVTDDGTVAAEVLELDSAMLCPLEGAAEASLTVPLSVTPPEIVVELRVSAESDAAEDGANGTSDRIIAKTIAMRFIDDEPFLRIDPHRQTARHEPAPNHHVQSWPGGDIIDIAQGGNWLRKRTYPFPGQHGPNGQPR